jgi:hypothetical protein
MNSTIKTIGTIALVGGSAYLIYRGLKKYVIKDSSDEKSTDKSIDGDVVLMTAPDNNEINIGDLTGGDGIITSAEYYNVKTNKEIGDKLIKSVSTPAKKEEILKNAGSKIKGGITYKDYFIRASSDKKGRLVVGKKNGRKSVYKVFGTIYLPLKLKSVYNGNFNIVDVDFSPVKKGAKVIEPIKLIDNTGKTFFVQQVELDNLIKRLESNSKKFKFITDKADFVLTRV